MGDTNIITELRQLTGLKQEQLANYLDISRSLVTMAENSNRELPTAAMLRLNLLHRLVQEVQPETQQIVVSGLPASKTLKAELAKRQLLIKRCVGQLSTWSQRYQHGETLLAVADRLKKELPAGEAGEDIKQWLGAVKAGVRQQRAKMPAKAVERIQLKLYLLQAEAAALEQLLDGIDPFLPAGTNDTDRSKMQPDEKLVETSEENRKLYEGLLRAEKKQPVAKKLPASK